MEITVFYAVLLATTDGEYVVEFVGVANSVEEAKNRALKAMKEDEYEKCVQYQLVGAHYGIL